MQITHSSSGLPKSVLIEADICFCNMDPGSTISLVCIVGMAEDEVVVVKEDARRRCGVSGDLVLSVVGTTIALLGLLWERE
mmetsp:Transcript_36588/g.48453  ORF Transcript_36588/g.48453 Transcript_36588/m.48453 type:complete len:81 (-) Transcript_36588:700-942(-)